MAGPARGAAQVSPVAETHAAAVTAATLGPDSGSEAPPLAPIAPVMGAVPGLAGADAPAQDAAAAALPPFLRALQQDCDRLNAAATAKYVAGDHGAAVDLLRRVLNLNPDSASAHNNLALGLWRAKRNAEAAIHCRRALTLNPS